MPPIDNIYYFLSSIVVILLTCTVGTSASSRFNFKYIYLGLVSEILYIGYGFIATKANFVSAIIGTSLLGLIESTLGHYLSIKFNANNGYSREENLRMIGVRTSAGMILVAVILGLVGIGLRYLLTLS